MQSVWLSWCGRCMVCAGCQSGPCTSETSERCGSAFENAVCSGGLCCSQYRYCGTTNEYCRAGCQSQCSSTPSFTPPSPSGSYGSGLEGVVYESTFNSFFPNQNPIYTHKNCMTAAASFPTFTITGHCNTCKKEVVAFFVQISHDTSRDYVHGSSSHLHCLFSSNWLKTCAATWKLTTIWYREHFEFTYITWKEFFV